MTKSSRSPVYSISIEMRAVAVWEVWLDPYPTAMHQEDSGQLTSLKPSEPPMVPWGTLGTLCQRASASPGTAAAP
ncbi:MAG: hypothetical protein ACKOCT_13530, partial [Alphaproteobacteria bacterium]